MGVFGHAFGDGSRSDVESEYHGAGAFGELDIAFGDRTDSGADFFEHDFRFRLRKESVGAPRPIPGHRP